MEADADQVNRILPPTLPSHNSLSRSLAALLVSGNTTTLIMESSSYKMVNTYTSLFLKVNGAASEVV